MARMTSPVGSLPEPAVTSRIPYGWRLVRRKGSDGTEEWVEVPLTVQDLLHPQEGDCIPENSLHSWERAYLYEVIGARLGDRPTVRVFSDCIIDWGIPGLKNHSPDISVFGNVRDRERLWKTFPVAKQRARPLLVIEIVSPDDQDPRRRDNDVVIKVEHYRRAGVPLYVIVDQEKENGPRHLLGYRKRGKRYVPLAADGRGRLLLEPVDMLLGLQENRLVCYDAAGGEEIPHYAGLERALAAATESRNAAEQQAEAAQRQAQAERAKAEAETRARTALEARIRELERRLERSNGGSSESGH